MEQTIEINKVIMGGLGLGRAADGMAVMVAGVLPGETVTVTTTRAHRGHLEARLVRVKGTALAEVKEIDGMEFVRTIAVARITMPRSVVRLSAGRETMSDELQALCFMAGAASIFRGEKLLTTPNPGEDRDSALFAKLGLVPA